MRCKFCGKEIKDTSYLCPYCGVKQPDEPEDGHIGLWGILCFLCPPVGLVLYALWKEKRPLRASESGSIVFFGIILFFAIFLFFLETVNAVRRYFPMQKFLET